MFVQLQSVGFAWMCLACFGLTVISAVVPWVNAELIVLSMSALASTRGALAAVVLAATAGQMLGKCAVYWAGRGGGRRLPSRIDAAVSRWRSGLRTRPVRAAALVFVSSVVGLPPFYVMSLVAGALEMHFGLYLAVGTAGRLIRFGTLVSVPGLVLNLLKW